ncbi:SMP-30/gluconolactonase/LRE family protein [Alteromonas sp. 14N.309.X.WAT.G.H12]|uniref:SMP-30/gluconolactonase/LRE family protein n=1 Tax=Alteromonas sp. 14N.309.X.WAT.G.H12 TaxID=3120824 RepID=UPI002FD5AD4E
MPTHFSVLPLFTILFMWASGACASDKVNNAEGDSSILPQIEVFDTKALNLIDPNANISIRSKGYGWSEGPLWIEQGQYLLFSDIRSNQIFKFHPQTGTSVYLAPAGATGWVEGDYAEGPNGLLLSPDGQLVIMQQGDRRIAVMDAPLTTPQPKFVTLAAEYQGKRLNSPNDGVYDSKGNLYFSDPPYGLKKGMDDSRKQLPFQGIYLLKANGELVLLDDSVNLPNGVVLTADGKMLIVSVSDPKHARWIAYDVQADGTIVNKRMFYDASDLVGKKGEQGLPDGFALHSSGLIFATGPGGVWLFEQTGKVLAKIRTGQISSNCALTSDEKTLYITTPHYLMSVSLR